MIAVGVAVEHGDALVIALYAGDHRPPLALAQQCQRARCQVALERAHHGFVKRLADQINQVGRRVAVPHVQPVVFELLAKGRFGVAALDGHQHWLVDFVAVLVEHKQNFAQAGEDGKSIAIHQVGVLQGDMRRQERFGDAAANLHGI